MCVCEWGKAAVEAHHAAGKGWNGQPGVHWAEGGGHDASEPSRRPNGEGGGGGGAVTARASETVVQAPSASLTPPARVSETVARAPSASLTDPHDATSRASETVVRGTKRLTPPPAPSRSAGSSRSRGHLCLSSLRRGEVLVVKRSRVSGVLLPLVSTPPLWWWWVGGASECGSGDGGVTTRARNRQWASLGGVATASAAATGEHASAAGLGVGRRGGTGECASGAGRARVG